MKMGNPSNAQRDARQRAEWQSIRQVFGNSLEAILAAARLPARMGLQPGGRQKHAVQLFIPARQLTRFALVKTAVHRALEMTTFLCAQPLQVQKRTMVQSERAGSHHQRRECT